MSDFRSNLTKDQLESLERFGRDLREGKIQKWRLANDSAPLDLKAVFENFKHVLQLGFTRALRGEMKQVYGA